MLRSLTCVEAIYVGPAAQPFVVYLDLPDLPVGRSKIRCQIMADHNANNPGLDVHSAICYTGNLDRCNNEASDRPTEISPLFF